MSPTQVSDVRSRPDELDPSRCLRQRHGNALLEPGLHAGVFNESPYYDQHLIEGQVAFITGLNNDEKLQQ